MSLLKGRSYLSQIIDITGGFRMQHGQSPVMISEGLDRLRNTSITIKNLLEVLDYFVNDTQTDSNTIIDVVEKALSSVITASADFSTTLGLLNNIPLLNLSNLLEPKFKNVTDNLKSVILLVFKVCVTKDVSPGGLVPVVNEYFNGLQGLDSTLRQILSIIYPIQVFSNAKDKFIEDVVIIVTKVENTVVNTIVANTSQNLQYCDREYIFMETTNVCKVEELYYQMMNFTCDLVTCVNSTNSIVQLFQTNMQDYTNFTIEVMKNVSLEIRQLLADTESLLSHNIPNYLNNLKTGAPFNNTIYSLLNSTDYYTSEIWMADHLHTVINAGIQNFIPYLSQINSTVLPDFLGNISMIYISNINSLVSDITQVSQSTILNRLDIVSFFLK
jgi:hypothetical protein